MQTHSSQLLIRPRPLPDESLGSWRQRTGWANGFRLYPMMDERTRRSDPDVGQSDQDMVWISDLHGADYTKVLDMSMRRYVGVITEKLNERAPPKWWLRSRYSGSANHFGPMFCPGCLQTDKIPYFRLRWRLGFVHSCTSHQLLLHDQCPDCQHPPWPSGCGVIERVHHGFTDLRHCWHCGADLSLAPRVPSFSKTVPELWLQSKAAVLGRASFPTVEALSALRAVCQLFLRGRSREAILKSKSKWTEVVENLSDAALKTQSVEQLRVLDRKTLVSSALEITNDWPKSFMSFSNASGISRTHFNGAMGLSPAWMNTLIDHSLAKQNRSVSDALLLSTFEELSITLGRRPTKYEIRKKLNWSGEKGLDRLFTAQ